MNAVELTRQLVQIDTINPHSPERPCAERVGNLLVDSGYSVATHEFAPGRASVVARREGAGPPICFAGHLDTVPLGAAPWTRNPFGGEVDAGKLYGRGSSDMKSGIAAMVEAALRLMDDILKVQRQLGSLSIILIEHEMSVIERVTRRCVVLNYGRKIAEGAYAEVSRDPEVREAYLGLE